MLLPSRKPSVSAAAILLAIALSGCSAKSSPSPSPSPTSSGQAAARVCNSLLSSQAAAALERLTGSKHFAETTLAVGEKVGGLRQAKSELLRDSSFDHRGTEFDLCLPRAVDDLTGGKLTISIQWLKLRSGDYTWTSNNDWTTFDISGKNEKDTRSPYASASQTTSWFAFRCPVGSGRNDNTVLTVNIFTDNLKGNQDDQTREDLTFIGYGTAVKLAKEMDCFKESRLPEELGSLKRFA